MNSFLQWNEMEYVGQTGRSFRIRFSEHFRDFKYAYNKSKFAQHLLENNHSIGPIDEHHESTTLNQQRKINGHNGKDLYL